VSQVKVSNPEERSEILNRGSRADFSFGRTDRLGVYKVTWNDQWQRSFAVNLLDPEESNLEPRKSISIGSEKVLAGKDRRQPRELWKWLVLLALALLLAEWYIYNRRVYV